MGPSGLQNRGLSNGVPHTVAGGAGRMLWPSTNAASFARVVANQPQLQAAKMMRTPDAYVATHDTMPPREQVIQIVPTHESLRQLYQQADRKMTGKRDTTSAGSELPNGELRPVKTPRAN